MAGTRVSDLCRVQASPRGNGPGASPRVGPWTRSLLLHQGAIEPPGPASRGIATNRSYREVVIPLESRPRRYFLDSDTITDTCPNQPINLIGAVRLAIITILNQKGGTSKSSTCHHLSSQIALMGKHVLLLDNDAQANLSMGWWGPVAVKQIDPAETIVAIYNGSEPYPEQIIRPTGHTGVDIIPGSRTLNSHNIPDPHLLTYDLQTRLREFLTQVKTRYDFIFIDCSPTLALCSWNALAASDAIIVPLQVELYGSLGLLEVQDTIKLVQSSINPALKLLGYLIVMFQPHKTVQKIYNARIRALYGSNVFETTIPYAADFPEAIMNRTTVTRYKPKGAAAKAIEALATEVIDRIALLNTIPSSIIFIPPDASMTELDHGEI